MQISVLQPALIPDIYYLSCLVNSDLVCIDAGSNWSRKGRSHRFKCRNANHGFYIQAPIKKPSESTTFSNIVFEKDTSNWLSQTKRSLIHAYKNSIYFDFYIDDVMELFEQSFTHSNFSDASININAFLFEKMELKQPEFQIYNESKPLSWYKNEKNATVVYAERNAQSYQFQDIIPSNPLPQHPTYYQHFDGFIEDCCLLDVLFELGPESFRLIEDLKLHN